MRCVRWIAIAASRCSCAPTRTGWSGDIRRSRRRSRRPPCSVSDGPPSRPRGARALLQVTRNRQKQVGYQAAALMILILIFSAPSNPAGRTQILNRGALFNPRVAGRRVSRTGPWMAHSAAHGSGSAGGYTEPRRGAEGWGKSLLLTFGWAGFRLSKVRRCKGATSKPPLPCQRICPRLRSQNKNTQPEQLKHPPAHSHNPQHPQE
jgi:hypothetical protein